MRRTIAPPCSTPLTQSGTVAIQYARTTAFVASVVAGYFSDGPGDLFHTIWQSFIDRILFMAGLQ
jgi:hypothetical protein